jgi:hypothetical protein
MMFDRALKNEYCGSKVLILPELRQNGRITPEKRRRLWEPDRAGMVAYSAFTF